MTSVAAAIVDRPGAEARLGSTELPARKPGWSLLRVAAAPLNPLDLLIASGTFHSARHEAPYVPGSECVGVILESETHAPEDWVYAECHVSPSQPGALAERVVVADGDLIPLPGALDPVLAAAIGNSGVAAYLPLLEVARLRQGESVLVLGVTGAVGQLAVQVARRHGGGRVVGVGRDRGELRRVADLGADATVDLRPGEAAGELTARLLAAGGPFDVVVDTLYGVALEAALGACAQRARVVNVGHAASPVAEIPAGLLRGKQLSLTGFAGLHTTLAEKRAALGWLWSALGRGELQVGVRTFALDQVTEAWRMQAGSPHAKCVVLPGSAERR